jgi:hypothetical protein
MKSSMPVEFNSVGRQTDGWRKHLELFLVGEHFPQPPWNDGNELGTRDQPSDTEKARNAKYDVTVNLPLGELSIDNRMARAGGGHDNVALTAEGFKRQGFSDAGMMAGDQTDKILGEEGLLIESGLETWHIADCEVGICRLQSGGTVCSDTFGFNFNAG